MGLQSGLPGFRNHFVESHCLNFSLSSLLFVHICSYNTLSRIFNRLFREQRTGEPGIAIKELRFTSVVALIRELVVFAMCPELILIFSSCRHSGSALSCFCPCLELVGR